MDGDGADAGPAAAVAAEIVAAGGAAVADTSDVATAAGAQALVDAAVEQFGRLDILINNAGIIRWAGLPGGRRGQPGPAPGRPRRRVVQHHPGRLAPHGRPGLRPHRHDHLHRDVRPARPTRLVRHRQGGRDRADPQPHHRRRRARHQGQPHRPGGHHPDGGPGATTRPRRSDGDAMAPELVAPMAAFLAHEACPVSGEIYAAGAGRFARIFIASTEGYVHPTAGADDRGRRRALGRRSTTRRGYYVPADLMAWSAAFMAHLPPTLATGPSPSEQPIDCMDFSLSEPERDLVELCRDFAQKEIAATGAAGLGGGAVPDRPAPRDGRARACSACWSPRSGAGSACRRSASSPPWSRSGWRTSRWPRRGRPT